MIDEKSWQLQYLYSYYFVTVTMVTVGFGDVVPSSNAEKLFSILSMLFSCGVYGYMLSRIGKIFE